jgi:hypothetical protein
MQLQPEPAGQARHLAGQRDQAMLSGHGHGLPRTSNDPETASWKHRPTPPEHRPAPAKPATGHSSSSMGKLETKPRFCTLVVPNPPARPSDLGERPPPAR